MKRTKLAFFMGMLACILIGFSIYVIETRLDLALHVSILTGLPIAVMIFILCYAIATGKYKAVEKNEKYVGIHEVKQELKGYSKNKLIQICISLQRDLLKVQKR